VVGRRHTGWGVTFGTTRRRCGPGSGNKRR